MNQEDTWNCVQAAPEEPQESMTSGVLLPVPGTPPSLLSPLMTSGALIPAPTPSILTYTHSSDNRDRSDENDGLVTGGGVVNNQYQYFNDNLSPYGAG